MFNAKGLAVVAALATLAGTSGCVYTHARVSPASSVDRPQLTAGVIEPANIAVSESTAVERPHTTLGSIRASARSISLMSSDPTRADVDEALRQEAGKVGADAVVGVTYHYERTGLKSRGLLTASGTAIRYTGDRSAR